MRVYSNAVNCTDESCGWRMWRTIAGKTITEPMLHALLKEGSTAVIKGFRSRSGKTFDASLRLSDNHELEFSFPQRKQTSKRYGK